ncbi:MAG: 4'-phosphopantetheinyl transferase family protein, partial [Spirochaetota bacterium]
MFYAKKKNPDDAKTHGAKDEPCVLYAVRICEKDFSRQMEMLSPYCDAGTMSRINSYRDAAGRQQKLFSHVLSVCSLRRFSGKPYCPEDITLSEKGKPVLRGGELGFSVSHCGQWAVCAVSRDPVGADIEALRPYDLRVSER